MISDQEPGNRALTEEDHTRIEECMMFAYKVAWKVRRSFLAPIEDLISDATWILVRLALWWREGGASFSTVVFRLLPKALRRMQWRKKTRNIQPSTMTDVDMGPELVLARFANSGPLDTVICLANKLANRDFELLWWRHAEGCTLREIAVERGVSIQAVQKQELRALERARSLRGEIT